MRALLVLAACSAAPERLPRPPHHPPPLDAAPTPPDAEPAPDDPTAEGMCHRRTLAGCFDAAEAMSNADDPQTRADAADLLRDLCTEGDRRGCFEADAAAELQAVCRAQDFAAACRELGRLHLLGQASCAYDLSCAEELFEMACTAGDTEACADAKLYAPRP